MGTVPLLTREGEVEIAKRIERGQNKVLKAITRSPVIIREILALGEAVVRDNAERLTSCLVLATDGDS
jgi:RNA polymerase primary sigma factor